MVEIGTGPGQVTEALCREMMNENISVPVIISDRAPGIAAVGNTLRKNFPALSIHDFIWNIREDPPEALLKSSPGRCCFLSASASPMAAMKPSIGLRRSRISMLMVEDLNLTGKKEAYDVIYEKIGLAVFHLSGDTENILKSISPRIHTCDQETIDAINLPVTDFTLCDKINAHIACIEN